MIVLHWVSVPFNFRCLCARASAAVWTNIRVLFKNRQSAFDFNFKRNLLGVRAPRARALPYIHAFFLLLFLSLLGIQAFTHILISRSNGNGGGGDCRQPTATSTLTVRSYCAMDEFIGVYTVEFHLYMLLWAHEYCCARARRYAEWKQWCWNCTRNKIMTIENNNKYTPHPQYIQTHAKPWYNLRLRN